MRYDPQSIVRAREHAGLSQADLAHRLDKSIGTIDRYERGDVTPPPHALDDIADVCEWPVPYDPTDPDDPVAQYAAAIKRMVADAPPLSEEQRTRLRHLLRGPSE